MYMIGTYKANFINNCIYKMLISYVYIKIIYMKFNIQAWLLDYIENFIQTLRATQQQKM